MVCAPTYAELYGIWKACHGTVVTGALDSSIGDCIFLAKDRKVADKIFKVCKMGDDCQVIAKVVGPDFQIVRVLSVRLTKIGQNH